MYIKKLQLSNFQVIKEFDADFSGNVYFVTGDNELGKSTLLKAIGALLTGNRDEVLRNGETKGFAKMIIGDDGEEYDVSLSFTENNPRGTLSIKQKSTGMQSNNISMLQKIFGYQDFDAVEFSRWSETAEGRRKQIAVVKALLPVEVRERIETIDVEVSELKQERTGVNRDAKTLSMLATEAESKLEDGDIDRYSEPIDMGAMMAEQAQAAALEEKAKQVRGAMAQRTEQLAAIPGRIEAVKKDYEEKVEYFNSRIEQEKAKYERIIADLTKDKADAKQAATDAIERINAEQKDYEARKANAENWLAEYEAKKPKNDIAAEIANANMHNEKHALVKDYLTKSTNAQDAIEKAAKMDEQVETLLSERANLITNAELPISGLSFTDDGLELNGTPFIPGRVSDSQIMEIATKLIIASNPTVKVFRIARGESLGAKRLENIIAIAKKYGFQGFIEQVQRGQTEMAVEEYTEHE